MVERTLEPELMDEPGLDPRLHRHALSGLRRINRVSRSDAILWPAIAHAARLHHPRHMRILDVGCGGGDVAVALWRRAARSGLPIQIDGCDKSSFAIEYAKEQAAECGHAVRFFQLDVLKQPLPGRYDVVMCSLFLHHLGQADAERLLRSMAAVGECVLVNDLRRSVVGYALAWAGCRLLTRSSIVHVDGPRSVVAAFHQDDLLQLARKSGLTGATISRHWPQRLLLSWRRT
jgi:2-polyprenyl-3-methyl-5-hydroxy-6-metoxy-1,4-benzoquinol methylase